jgi:hypothetical protein
VAGGGQCGGLASGPQREQLRRHHPTDHADGEGVAEGEQAQEGAEEEPQQVRGEIDLRFALLQTAYSESVRQ